MESESRHVLQNSSKCPNVYFSEQKSRIAYAALAPRFASIQTILDSVEVLENYEVILAKVSSSRYDIFMFSHLRLAVCPRSL